MLVLTRRIGEKIMIGDNVTLTVLDVNGTQVSLGVKAPREISVHREEVYRRIKIENAREKSLECIDS